MARVKILLDQNEDQLDADLAINKAFNLHASGAVHDQEKFNDPAVQHALEQVVDAYAKMYAQLLREISAVLDEEFSDGYQ